MEFAVNEWLLDCQVPSSPCLREAQDFLDALQRKGDKLLVRFRSPFMEKFYRYSKRFPLAFRRFARLLRDLDAVHLVYEHEILLLPEQVQPPDEDRYLAELAYSSPDKAILSTDGKLRDAIHGAGGLKVLLVGEFMPSYTRD